VASTRREKRLADLAKLFKAKRDLGVPPAGAGEEALWVLIAHHGTREGATRALQALWKRYVDLNEFRVAKPTEVAAQLEPYVKNDPYRVAEQLHGFLWHFHKTWHTLDFGVVRGLALDQLRRYLRDAECFAREIALALFLHGCNRERERLETEAAPPEEGVEKPRRRTDREFNRVIERLRLLCAFASDGCVPAKSKIAVAHRRLVKAWDYAPLPVPTESEPAADTAKKKTTVAKKKAAAKKKAPAGKKTESARGGGAARPRTTPAARGRTSAKKSSRR